ncbi:MAG: TraB/GumN family protein, partial [Firmicutes bacterium]|nr:TraB/GumN family protein [Bacillota bacterium]
TMESFSGDLTRYLIEDEVRWILRRNTLSAENTLEQWPAFWRTGDAENFWLSYRQSIESADRELYGEYEDKLIVQRNTLMAARLDEMFQSGGTYFVTVGLLHLIYEDNNLPDLLGEMGYAVERVSD